MFYIFVLTDNLMFNIVVLTDHLMFNIVLLYDHLMFYIVTYSYLSPLFDHRGKFVNITNHEAPYYVVFSSPPLPSLYYPEISSSVPQFRTYSALCSSLNETHQDSHPHTKHRQNKNSVYFNIYSAIKRKTFKLNANHITSKSK